MQILYFCINAHRSYERSLVMLSIFIFIYSPWRILEDAGMAFAMGTIGGGTWHFVKGYRNSPIGDRLRGALKSMQYRAPVLGGNFSVWGGMFSTFDCALISLRQKEDAWNAIASGALTGGVLAARGGPAMSFRSALIGGIFLALIEGAALGLNRIFAEQYRPPSTAPSS